MRTCRPYEDLHWGSRNIIAKMHTKTSNNNQIQDEVACSLSPLEQQLLATRIEVRGKRGRKVAVLLTQAHQRRVELLNKTREVGNIDQENVYQFPRSSPCKTPLCSCTILRKFVTECGAEKPQFLTSTCLRKHITGNIQGILQASRGNTATCESEQTPDQSGEGKSNAFQGEITG